jgi:Uma2 family endonuclease
VNTVAVQADHVSVQEYLAAEEQSEMRHEYLGGVVYAMSGATRRHNAIAGNFYINLRQHLQAGSCRVYMSDVRVNLAWQDDQYFYYPDVVVTCAPDDNHPRFVRQPVLLVEVLSDSTRRVDQREKLFAYRTIESLQEYVLVEPDRPEITIHRRSADWAGVKYAGEAAIAELSSVGVELPLARVYDGA